MHQALRACDVVLLQQQLGQPQVRQGKFGTKANLAGCLQGLRVVRARGRPVANQYRGISQMAPYACLEQGADGQVSNAVKSRYQCTGCAAVANSDCGLEKVEESEEGFVVTRLAGNSSSMGPDECTGLLQAPELGEAGGSSRCSSTVRAKTSHADEFVEGWYPGLCATEVARYDEKHLKAEHPPAKRCAQLVSTFDQSRQLNQRVFQVPIHDCHHDVAVWHKQPHRHNMRSLGQFLDLSPESLGSGSLARGQLKGAREPEQVPQGLTPIGTGSAEWQANAEDGATVRSVAGGNGPTVRLHDRAGKSKSESGTMLGHLEGRQRSCVDVRDTGTCGCSSIVASLARA